MPFSLQILALLKGFERCLKPPTEQEGELEVDPVTRLREDHGTSICRIAVMMVCERLEMGDNGSLRLTCTNLLESLYSGPHRKQLSKVLGKLGPRGADGGS